MKLFTELMAHQQEAFDMVSKRDAAALFMQTGAGKSAVALALAVHRQAKRILVTSDKNNTINTWPPEIFKHTDYEVIVRPNLKQLQQLPEVCAVCVNYDYLPKHQYMLSTIPWDMWIADESSLLKDHRTHRVQCTYKLGMGIKRRVLLNGTPMTERIEDLWGQFKFIDEQALGRTITQFRNRYMVPAAFGYVAQPSALTRIQRDTHGLAFWMPQSAIKMPKVHRYLMRVPMTSKQEAADTALREKFKVVMNDAVVETNYAAVVFSKRVQLCGGVIKGDEEGTQIVVGSHKLAALDQINLGYKTIVWHKYVHETELLSKYYTTRGVPFVVVDSSKDTGALKKFQGMKTGVCLIRTAYCRGLNQLADADVAVFYSNPFSYMERAQAEGRTRRLNTPHADTHIVDLVTEGGADEIIYQMIQHKASVCLTLANLKEILDSQIKLERR
jgi:hypothetical protein